MLSIRPIRDNEIEDACALLLDVFMIYNKLDATEEGVNFFKKLVSPVEFRHRITQPDGFCLIALDQENLIGVVEVERQSHVKMLYVDGRTQKGGVGTALLNRVFEQAYNQFPNAKKVTLNSAPSAIDFYLKYGFTQLSDPITRGGLTFIPMEKQIPDRE